MKKEHKEIPQDVAADALFLSDRTCCVCRVRRKPVQLHHIDEDPGHSVPENLAVLCLECHDDTQVKGGFGRKLNAAQVIRYRDDWYTDIANARKILALPSSVGADLTSNVPADALDHDRRIFRGADQLFSEDQLMEILWRLDSADSFLVSQLGALRNYMRYLRKVENEFVTTSIRTRSEAMLLSVDELVAFVNRNFFNWPRKQETDDTRYCLYPELNVDRAGDGEHIEEYVQWQAKLDVVVNAALVSWRDFRRAVKYALFI